MGTQRVFLGTSKGKGSLATKMSYYVNEHLLQSLPPVIRYVGLYNSMHLKAAALFLWISAWHASQQIRHEARPEAGNEATVARTAQGIGGSWVSDGTVSGCIIMSDIADIPRVQAQGFDKYTD